MVETDVLVVGAGPVGLALAGDLGWRGVSCRLVERGDGGIHQPKMDLVGIRTMEICRRWGIVGDVEASPYPRDHPQDNVYVTSVTGYEIGRERVPAMADDQPPRQSPQHRERCPQDMFDPVLRRFAESLDTVTMSYGTTFEEFTEDDDGVTVGLRTAGGKTEVIRAAFLVGCDGAASTVRRAAGITMSGRSTLTRSTNIIFRSTALAGLHTKGRPYRFIVIGPEGTWATLVAINGRDRWRMSIIGDDRNCEHTSEEVHAAIVRAVGIPFAYEIESVVPWTRSELVAERYCTRSGGGRVFVAGDAAHVMSPTGGFGMNTGIADAVDLSWKISATLAGWGGPDLTGSYEAERLPVARRNVDEASRNLDRMLSTRRGLPPPEFLDDSPAGRAARETVGARFAEAMRHEWHTLDIHLGYRYDDSPIVVPDGTPAPQRRPMVYEQIARPGARAPHVWLADGRSTLDLFGHGFVLLRLGAAAPDAATLIAEAAAAGVPLRVVTLDDPAVNAAYQAALVLVRPDGHVAWRWRKSGPLRDAAAVIATVRGAGTGVPVTVVTR